MTNQVCLTMTLLLLGLACKKRDEAAPPVKTAEPSAARPTSPSLDQYLTSSSRDDERKPLPTWDAAGAAQYLEACNKANEPLTAFRVRDCACETDRWTGREYQEWKLKQQPVNEETCSTSAGRKAWFGAKTSAFLVTCARDGMSPEACQCLVEVLFTRNLSEERLRALTLAHDAAIEACSTKGAPATRAIELNDGDYAEDTKQTGWARDAVLAFCQQTQEVCEYTDAPCDTDDSAPLHVENGSATLDICSNGCSYRAQFRQVDEVWQVTEVERITCGD